MKGAANNSSRDPIKPVSLLLGLLLLGLLLSIADACIVDACIVDACIIRTIQV